jgi:hypothetical protein
MKFFSTLGIAPFLRNQVPTGFEVQSAGKLRQIAQSGQVNALEILVNQHFGAAQQRREFAWSQGSVVEEPVEVKGELAVSLGHRWGWPLTLPSHDEPPRRSSEDTLS